MTAHWSAGPNVFGPRNNRRRSRALPGARRRTGRLPERRRRGPVGEPWVPPRLLASPRHDPAAEGEPPRLDVRDAGAAPRVEQPRLRPLLVEAADRRSEERADLAPAVADHRARRREPGADPELPGRAGEPVRQ